MCCNNTNTFNVSLEGLLDTVLNADDGIVDERDIFLFGIIGMSTIGTIFATFGVTTNIINIVVFVKIGFKDSINMSLFALAISDLMSCLTMFPCILATNSYIVESMDQPVNWFHVGHVVGAWPHVAFTKITTLITAFITVERCLCVFMPLKVKTIITRRRVKCYLISSYVFVGSLLASVFYSNQLGWTFSPVQNRTILGLIFPAEREDIEKVTLPIMNAFISIFAFVLIIISTIVLVVTLKKKAEWRLSATRVTKQTDSAPENNVVDTKEQRISKMVVMISTLFIASLFPTVITLLILWIDRRFDFGGPYASLFVIMGSCTYILETINATMNIFIYYKNSSNYKAMLDQICCSRFMTDQAVKK